MRDLNFFEPYIEKRSFKFDKVLILYILLFFTIIGVVAYSVYNYFTIRKLESDIDYRTGISQNSKTIKKVNEIKMLEDELTVFREEVTKIKGLDEIIESKDVIDDELLRLVENKMPEDMFLTTFSVYDGEIQIIGISKDKYAIAEFAKGLSSIEEYNEVFISNISQIEDYYNFNLNIALKDVSNGGNEPEE
ncbi:PilN domain-containing protein [Paratissierella segnis]|jgi:type IV pilus assembly protein PilN|uniref:PilN domain-containing protein n=1 Tax=Paratissierella segnis TaxID=2763679 RepID=A0A926ERL4_9FIRM|nr:PilN domain-containing protein [Paratissierella segnis]MBC8588453.1 PilN domain-containing protein [Paratissierella segnis]